MDAALIIESLETAAERCPDLTPLVYERLFAEHPEMEALFIRDSDGSVRGEMLAGVFEAILDFLGPGFYAARLIQCEVVTHEGYGVPRDIFAVFFGTVARAIAQVNGANWTRAMQGAWDELLARLDHFVTHPDQFATADLG